MRLRQEEHEFKTRVGYIARPCLKLKTNKKYRTQTFSPAIPSLIRAIVYRNIKSERRVNIKQNSFYSVIRKLRFLPYLF
jgi:hypothetical protein